jgi:hypothetical protein
MAPVALGLRTVLSFTVHVRVSTLKPVFRIRIRRTRKFFAFWASRTDPLVKGTDPGQAKIVRKPLISTVLCLLYDFLTLKNDVNAPSKTTHEICGRFWLHTYDLPGEQVDEAANMIAGEKRLKGTVVGEKYPKETIRSDKFFPPFLTFGI